MPNTVHFEKYKQFKVIYSQHSFSFIKNEEKRTDVREYIKQLLKEKKESQNWS